MSLGGSVRIKKELIVTICASLLIIILVSIGSSIDKISTTARNNKAEEKVHKQDRYELKNKNCNDVKKDSSINDNVSKKSNTQANIASYDGISKGFKGDIKVRVKVDSGKISDIEILESSDDEEYFNNAKNLIGDIIHK